MHAEQSPPRYSNVSTSRPAKPVAFPSGDVPVGAPEISSRTEAEQLGPQSGERTAAPESASSVNVPSGPRAP